MLALLLSCDRDDIVHPYKVDLSSLSKIDSSKSVDLRELPKPDSQLAKLGINSSSNSTQPDGVKDWIRYELPSKVPGRNVAVDLRIFIDTQRAKDFMSFDSVSRWYRPKVDKFSKGILPNGLEYCASYIVQHRADPEGCSRPMDSYSSFVLFRSGQYLITIDVHENTDRPLGVTAKDIEFAISLLNT